MDNKFLNFYNQELKFIREMGAEFAAEYPKIAGRLGMDGIDCSDPYVERILEGFAFLSARVHLKLDAAFPDFTQHLTDIIYPTLQLPTPSMLTVKFEPDYDEGSLTEGFTINKGTNLHGLLNKGQQTNCQFITSQDVTLWPVELVDAHYINSQEIVTYLKGKSNKAKSGVLLKLTTPSGINFNELTLNDLALYIRGSESFPMHLFETIFKGFKGCLYKCENQPWRSQPQATSISSRGFTENESLLPMSNRQFDGFRLLKEYFHFPDKFLYLVLENINAMLQQCSGNQIEIMLLLDHFNPRLENLVSADNFELYSTPAINLFSKRIDRVNVDTLNSEFHLVPDRLKPLDYEVMRVDEVIGVHTGGEANNQFFPMYACHDSSISSNRAFYSINRKARFLNNNQKITGHRSSYLGTELFISIVDTKSPPFPDSLKQLAIKAQCSNRDLPLMMPIGKSSTDFTFDIGAPCESVKCLGEPTKPLNVNNYTGANWDLINLLSANMLGFEQHEKSKNLEQLKSLITILINKDDHAHIKMIEGIIDFSSEYITSRLPFSGPICFARGILITIKVEEAAFEGNSAFMLGMVLNQFFAQYVTVNSFIQLKILSIEHGELFEWPIQIGTQHHI